MGKSKESTAAAQTLGLAEAKREALLDAEAKESQVLTLIAKRLRTARKKVKKAEEIEAGRESGKPINSDQEEAIRSKVKNLAAIEELERLFPLLKEAVNAELADKVGAKAVEIELKAKEGASIEIAEQVKAIADAHEIEKSKADALAEDLKLRAEEALNDKLAFERQNAEEKTANETRLQELQASGKASTREAVSRILKLFYFSRLFAKEGFANDYVPTTERSACLSYDQSLEPTEEALTDRDLEDFCSFGKHISSRPPSDIISHEKALERCITLAMDWVNAEETTMPFLNTSVGELVTKFERILASDYCTVQPREVAPEVKFVPNHNTAFQPEIPAGARSRSLNGFHPGPTTFPAANGPHAHGGQGNHIPNGNLLQRALNQRSGQLPAEAIAFMPPFIPQSNQQQQQQQPPPHQPPASHHPAGQIPPAGFQVQNQQPPGFELGDQNKQTHLPANTQASAGSYKPTNQPYQGTLFGGISQTDLVGSQPQATHSHQPSYTPLHDATPSTTLPLSNKTSTTEPAGGSHAPLAEPEHAGVRVEFSETQGSESRNDSRNGPANGAQQQPRGPQDQYRGKGYSRGRGGRGGDYVPRGGRGQRGSFNPGRGQRGGRREFAQQAPHPTAAY